MQNDSAKIKIKGKANFKYLEIITLNFDLSF